ncbi:peptidase S8/S53 domain-containing protein [Syncephalis fuscata]|nr:peptidase S8/S53 domain-containing protein [Syncephalis fuscata]
MRVHTILKTFSLLAIFVSAVCSQPVNNLLPALKGFTKGEPISTVIVEMHEEPGTKELEIYYEVRLVYQVAINGISMRVENRDIDAIWGIKQVKHVWLMASATVAGQVTGDSGTSNSKPFTHAMTGVDRVHKLYGLSGKGIKVGIIDTGIDYLHPALGGCFGPKCRVAYGWDFVGDDYQGNGSPMVPDADPRDTCGGHGTHIAGIIGANEAGLVGVAPQVTFGAYRISGCNSALEGDVLIAAMERALIDRMDVINLSIYTGNTWEDNPRASTAERLAARGVVVVAAMGNVGRQGVWQSSAPAIAPLALSIASVDNVALVPTVFELQTKQRPLYSYVTLASGSIFNFTNVNILSVPAGIDNSGCKFVPQNSHGTISLISQTGCTIAQKVSVARSAGVTAIIVYGGELSSMASVHQNDPKATAIPVIFISEKDGQSIWKILATQEYQHGVRANFNPSIEPTPNETGGQISEFSSWGPSPDLDIKPDVAAPGGNIFSTYPLTMGSYTVMSGTSMATPYVVGAVALGLQAKGRRDYSVTSYRQAFQNTAQPISDPNVPGRYTSVAKQGAGLINVERMIYGTTNVAPGRIALNDTEFGMKNGACTRKITIFNDNPEDRVFAIAHLPAMSVRGIGADGVVPNKPEQKDAAAQVTISTPKVYVKAGGSAQVNVQFIEPPSLPSGEYWIYSGFIEITPVSGPNGSPVKDASIHKAVVPYLGIKGRMRDLHLPSLISAREPVIYTMANNDYPELTFPGVYLYNADTNKYMGTVPGFLTEHLGRNDLTKDNESYKNSWVGSYTINAPNRPRLTLSAPNGRYYIKISALHYDVWQSPTMIIKR